ncbi:MAG TPA: hypothetical protein VJO32_09240 [Ktedonobacteraceae bacterium]|nr:hypothetical protein [Ktedonobacteraceae bacterium]
MTHIVSQTKKVAACSEYEKETFYRLLCHEFSGVSWHDFMRDFREKDAVMILRKEHDTGEIVGWSTLMVLTLDVAGKEVKGVFSGDTAVLPEYRHSTGLGVELSRYFMQAYRQFPLHHAYYILISKGWRTYKIMPFFFKEFFPRYDKLTSAGDRAVIDAFGQKKYPHHYQSATGVITFSPQRVRLESIDAIPAKMDEHTRFFLRSNPGYLEGHELVCIARITPDNFTNRLKRVLGSDGYE